MENLVPERTGVCSWVLSTRATNASPPEPFQLSFLSPLPGATAGQGENPHEDDREYIDITRRLRRRRCRSLRREDVEQANSNGDTRALLRKPSGELLPPLYARDLAVDRGGETSSSPATHFNPPAPTPSSTAPRLSSRTACVTE